MMIIEHNPVSVFFDSLNRIDDSRISQIRRFYERHSKELTLAKGSQTKHQAWPGGYADHLCQCLQLCDHFYPVVATYAPQPFTLAQAKIVLLFHDIEKLFKYGREEGAKGFDKERYLFVDLKHVWDINFSADEVNALHYTHGEGHDYSPTERKMGPLASFVHCVDTVSARNLHHCGPLIPTSFQPV